MSTWTDVWIGLTIAGAGVFIAGVLGLVLYLLRPRGSRSPKMREGEGTA